MSKKTLHVESITNDLKGASLFFTRPATSPIQPLPSQPPVGETGKAQPEAQEHHAAIPAMEPVSERNSERTEFRSENRSDTMPALFPRKRRTTRYSFEFYEDQILKLKEVKHRAEMDGEKVTLSDIAREALDKYLKDKGF